MTRAVYHDLLCSAECSVSVENYRAAFLRVISLHCFACKIQSHMLSHYHYRQKGGVTKNGFDGI